MIVKIIIGEETLEIDVFKEDLCFFINIVQAFDKSMCNLSVNGYKLHLKNIS